MSESLAALVEARPFTCVVYDSYEQWVLPVARRVGLLAVPFSTQSCAVSAVYFHFSQGRLAVPLPDVRPEQGSRGVTGDGEVGVPVVRVWRWAVPVDRRERAETVRR